jgi:hypothetical protein
MVVGYSLMTQRRAQPVFICLVEVEMLKGRKEDRIAKRGSRGIYTFATA